MRGTHIRKLIWGLLAVTLILVALIYAAAEPDSILRYAVFRGAYSMPVTRGWVLRQYSNFLDNHNGGYTGEGIDTFLCSRLKSNPDDSEMAAILDFYGFRAGGREGHQISKIPDASKQRAIPLLLQKVDSYDERQALGLLLIVENMRRGETISKGGFGPTADEWKQPSFSWDRWWAERGVSEAKAKYKHWWNMDLAWNQKRLVDPLIDSNVKVTLIR